MTPFQIWLMQNPLSDQAEIAVWISILGQCLAAVQAELCKVLGKPVRFGNLAAVPAGTRPIGEFGVKLAHPALKMPALVMCDNQLTRSLADSVECSLRVPRGAGPLTDVECGLLEYLTLSISEGIARAITGPCPTILRFLNLRELMTLPAEEVNLYRFIEIPALIGLTWGRIAVGMPPLDQNFSVGSFDTAPPSAFPLPESNADVSFMLAMRPITISTTEEASLSVGDVLLTGRDSFQSPGWNFELVSHSGWRLFKAEVLEDSATTLRVSVSDRGLRPWAGLVAKQPQVYWPVMGSINLQASEIASLASGTKFDMSLRAGHVVLWTKGKRAWRGELVRIQQEIGVLVQGQYA